MSLGCSVTSKSLVFINMLLLADEQLFIDCCDELLSTLDEFCVMRNSALMEQMLEF